MTRTATTLAQVPPARATGNSKRRNADLPAVGSPVINQTIAALRKMIFAAPGNDAFLGFEKDLIAELGVSRPTFRQAARLLEHEALLTIRRGSSGGFYAQPHSSKVLSRMAATHLNARGTNLQQISNAMSPILEEAAALLATSNDSTARYQLADFHRRNIGFEALPDHRQRLRIVLEFETLIGDLCGNPAMALMLNVMRDLVRDPRHASFGLLQEHARAHAEFHAGLVEAILKKDAEMARLLTRRHVVRVDSWLPAMLVAPD